MQYAREVMELMGAYPGRDFRMVELVRYVGNGRELDLRSKRAMRKAVLRVLGYLAGAGVVLVRPPASQRGGLTTYRWRKT